MSLARTAAAESRKNVDDRATDNFLPLPIQNPTSIMHILNAESFHRRVGDSYQEVALWSVAAHVLIHASKRNTRDY